MNSTMSVDTFRRGDDGSVGSVKSWCSVIYIPVSCHMVLEFKYTMFVVAWLH